METQTRVGEILETRDYSIFKFDDTNRAIDPTHLERIGKSLLRYGYIAGNPIMVARDMTVIDGQHRLSACKALDIPVQYVVADADASAVIPLNITQKTWSLMDYAHHYQAKGNENYTRALNFAHMHNIKNFGVALAYITRVFDYSRSILKTFKEGELVVTDRDMLEGGILYDATLKLFATLGMEFKRKTYQAVVNMSNNPDFNVDRLLAKAEKFRDQAYPTSTVRGTMVMLQDLYNFHEKKKNRVQFI